MIWKIKIYISFTSTDSCSTLTDKNYKISSTKECVTTCPSSNFYYSYECIDIDFTEQEYGKILDQQCSSTQINSPKYYLGKYCYESCPLNSINIESTFECKCNYAWHKDLQTNEDESCIKTGFIFVFLLFGLLISISSIIIFPNN